jgi:Transposase DDE domain
MHAERILQKCLAGALETIHAARVKVLLAAVCALLLGRRLVLMDLARAWPGAQRVRAPLKRLDRLLSNVHLDGERSDLYAAMGRWLLKGPQPVIIVDWSSLDGRDRFHVLRAGIPVEGRTLTLLEEVHRSKDLGKVKVERAFLKALKTLVPPDMTPIIVTDAGFRTPWFRAVRKLGWDYIGRVRGKVTVRLAKEQPWEKLKGLLDWARLEPTSFANVEIAKSDPWPCRLVLARRRGKGRKLLTKHGTPSRAGRSVKAQRRASEPCLLATSLTRTAKQIVALYATRMQIEESFRDLKCERFGAGFELSLTRTQSRIAILLLLHALASFVAYLVACSLPERLAAVVHGGVVGTRRYYSRIWLGWQALLKPRLPITPLSQLIRTIRYPASLLA